MKKKWLLLHGALGSKEQLESLKLLLNDSLDVSSMSLIGHGERPPTELTFSIPLFAQDVITYMENNDIDQINIFGHSMGGYVALYLAYHYPERISSVVTLGTKFDWSKEFAENENRLINPSMIEKKVPKFAEILKNRHSGSCWKEVLKKSSEILLSLGSKPVLSNDCYTGIKQEIKILLGDKDNMVSTKESIEVSDHLPNGSFHVISDSEHNIEKVNLENLITFFH